MPKPWDIPSRTLFFVHLPSEKRLAEMEEEANQAIHVIAGQAQHLAIKLRDVAKIIQEHGDLELQLKVSNVLLGRES